MKGFGDSERRALVARFAKGQRAGGIAAVALGALGAILLSTGAATADCSSLSGNRIESWTAGHNGNWSSRDDWNIGRRPVGAATSVCIADGLSTVTLNERNYRIDELDLGSGNSLDIKGRVLTISGPELIDPGTIRLEAGSTNAVLAISDDVTLSGGGIIILGTSGSGDAKIKSRHGPNTLTNMDTIEGAGTIGKSRLNVVNDGTIDADVTGQSLAIDTRGWIDNSGIFEADAGSTLHLVNGTFMNFSAGTLTGGTYIVSGTMKINQLGSKGGEIVNNDAAILMQGTKAALVDKNGNNALSGFRNNEAGGNFSIGGGYNFSAPGAFINSGQVTVGEGSAFTASKLENGGNLQGAGTIVGDLLNYGTVAPGDVGNLAADHMLAKMAVDGNYTQGSTGTLEISIRGLKDYGQLDVTGSTKLGGTLSIDLVNGFKFSHGDKFDILSTADKAQGNFSALNLDGVNCSEVGSRDWHCGNLDGLTLAERITRNAVQLSAVPEPDSLALLFGGVGGLLLVARRRRSRERAAASAVAA